MNVSFNVFRSGSKNPPTDKTDMGRHKSGFELPKQDGIVCGHNVSSIMKRTHIRFGSVSFFNSTNAAIPSYGFSQFYVFGFSDNVVFFPRRKLLSCGKAYVA